MATSPSAVGADHVIDYTREDFAQGPQRYDLIVATAGHRSLFDYRRALTPSGTYVMIGGAMSQVFQAILLGPWLSMVGGQTLSNLAAKPSQSDLAFVKGLLESGQLKPVIDRTYPLSAVAEAIRYYDEGHARGKVIISVAHDGAS